MAIPNHIHFHLEISNNQCCNWCCQSNPIILYDSQSEKFKPEKENRWICIKAQPERDRVTLTWNKVDQFLTNMYGDHAVDFAYLLNPHIKKQHDSNFPLKQKSLITLFSSTSALFKSAAFVNDYRKAATFGSLKERSKEVPKLLNVTVIQDDGTKQNFNSDKIVKKILSFEYNEPVSKSLAKQVADCVIQDLNDTGVIEINHEQLRSIVARNLKLTGRQIIADQNIENFLAQDDERDESRVV